MDKIKQHLFSFFSIVLVCAVLFPSAIKLTHAFENHKHEVCDGEKTAHFHEVDIDCEFYKFNINHAFEFVNFKYSIIEFTHNHSLIHSQYFFISAYQQLGVSLRGPPYLV